MERKQSRKTDRGPVLPAAETEREVQSQPAAGKKVSSVGFSSDVLRLDVEETVPNPRYPRTVAVQANGLFERIKAVSIWDPDSFQLVGSLVRSVKQVREQLETFFEDSIKKAHEVHKATLANRDRSIDELHLEEAEVLAKEKLARYVHDNPNTGKLEGVSFSDDWKAEIIDETMIPREYMKPDMQKIVGVASAMKEATDIPGIKVSCRKKVSVRK